MDANNVTPNPTHPESGFTLIELLVVILIVGILAAIAIPSFISQTGKAGDSQAKTLARNAATAIETYATDHEGDFSGAVPSTLNSIEPQINVTSNTSSPFVTNVSAGSNDYTITVKEPATGDAFTIVNVHGSVTRSCTGTGGGCVSGTW